MEVPAHRFDLGRFRTPCAGPTEEARPSQLMYPGRVREPTLGDRPPWSVSTD
jgi:hypothetical protein